MADQVKVLIVERNGADLGEAEEFALIPENIPISDVSLVGTDVKAAIIEKYPTTNPAGYETPSQLNSRDTANRARNNHTGTQLAATISNFAATVLSTVLAGLSLVTATPVVAADSILVAIGKLQAQINTMVFGREYQYFEDLTPFTTTSTALVQAAIFSASFVNGHEYRLNMQWNFTTNSTTNSAAFRVFVNGVAQGSSILIELKDTTDIRTYQTFVKYTATSTGNLNIELRTSMEGSSSVTVSTVRCDLWRVL